MDIQINKNNVILTNAEDFNADQILNCGQCFRWNKNNDGSFTGIAWGKPLMISQPEKDTVIFHETSLSDFYRLWYPYFDLGRDYGAVKRRLSQDPILKEAIAYGSGIRILRQELWETVVSFIISASNNIPRIKKIIGALCANFGNKSEYMGNIYYSFPSPARLASLTVSDLSPIRAGFRDSYILDAARKFASGAITAEILSARSDTEAKKLLMSIHGVGNKVADCILLFGLGQCSSFPVDVWIKRVVEHYYFNRNNQPLRQIQSFAEKAFGEYGGFAQQYLFFYARENKL